MGGYIVNSDELRAIAHQFEHNGWVFDAIHPWQYVNGEWSHKLRMRKPNGHVKPKKRMFAVHRTADGPWVKGANPATVSIKRLPYLMESLWALDETNVVFWVEGEKCAEAIARFNIAATTAGGANDADGVDYTRLPPGRIYRLWPDHHDTGQQHMQRVAQHLLAQGHRVELMDVASLDLPEGGDVVDWRRQHPSASREDLLHLPAQPYQKIAGNTGNTGDTASDKSLRVSGMSPAATEPVTEDDAAPHFELHLDGADGPPGVYYVQERPATKRCEAITVRTWVCGPLSVTHATRDGEHGEWGRRLTFIDPDGHEHAWTMPMAMLAGDGCELREELLRQGLALSSNADVRRLLMRYLATSAPIERGLCTDRTGWHGDDFVLPHTTMQVAGGEPKFYQAPTMADIPIGVAGDLTSWREYVAMPCAGNSRLVFAISAAFAAMTLGLLDAPGCILHYRGLSSTGKSTLLQLATSVYGPPDRYMVTWRQTDNGLEGVAHQHTDLLLPLDELGQLDPKAASRVAYMLAEGVGKVRANRAGAARKPARWRVLALSSGEVSLGDLLAQAKDIPRAGQEVRVIDLPADAECGFGVFDQLPDAMTAADFAERLSQAARTHYGTALVAFIEAIQRDPATARVVLRKGRDALAQALTADTRDGQVRRVAQQLALVAAAGEWATAAGLTGWSMGEAERAVTTVFKHWLTQRGTRGNLEPEAILERLREAIEKHSTSRFIPWLATPEETARVRDCLGYVDTVRDDPEGTAQVYYLFSAGFKEIMTGFNTRLAARVLADWGVLERDKDCEHWTRTERLPGRGVMRVYKIQLHKLSRGAP